MAAQHHLAKKHGQMQAMTDTVLQQPIGPIDNPILETSNKTSAHQLQHPLRLPQPRNKRALC